MIVAGARTPIGKFRGALAGSKAVELGAHAIRAALDRAGIAGEQVDYAIMGHVLQAGAGQITSRQAAIGAGLPKDVPAITINKVCLSGMAAIAMADQMIRAGEIEVAVAGGMESMTNAPYVLPEGSRRVAAGRCRADRLDDPRRSVVVVPRPAHGGGDRRGQRGARSHARGAGRVGGAVASAGARRVGVRTDGRRGRRGRGAAAEGLPSPSSIGTKGSAPTRRRRRWPG